MKSLLSELRPAATATLVLAAVTCGLYPAAVTGVAQVLFPNLAHGSLIFDKEGMVRGSALLGQNFTGKGYFHPRPSAAGNGYDATGSGGSNLGPTSKKLRAQIQERLMAYRVENGLSAQMPVPADAVTASGSGLDPHISLKNAGWQAGRVAAARKLSDKIVRELITANIEGRGIGILGEAGVNVLKLNLALDALK